MKDSGKYDCDDMERVLKCMKQSSIENDGQIEGPYGLYVRALELK